MVELVLYIVIGVVLGFFIGSLLSKLNFEKSKTTIEKERSSLQEKVSLLLQSEETLKNNIDEKQTELKNNQKEKEELLQVNSRLNSEITNLQEKLDSNKNEVEKLQEKFTKDFEILANKILEEKSTKFTNQNKENLKTILNPLQEKIKGFEEKVDKTHKESIDYHAALRQQILGLKELNQQMSKDTLNLTRALKGDSKMQGNWGELVLERVLEKSGLEKDREYYIQQSFTNEEGKRVLPDVVIHLPDNKKMIIDSKVSLVAYEKYINEEDETLRAQHLKDHVNSLKRHVTQLSEKKYEDLYRIESPDFVLLFIPIEPAFAAALNADNRLYINAFEKNIVIVTPSTLLAVLSTIDTMWTNEKQQRNAIEIARQAGALYDKFEGLLSDLIGIGKKIDASKSDYNAAMNKLVEGRGNLITSVEKLKKMGAKAKKSLPQNIIERANDTSD